MSSVREQARMSFSSYKLSKPMIPASQGVADVTGTECDEREEVVVPVMLCRIIFSRPSH